MKRNMTIGVSAAVAVVALTVAALALGLLSNWQVASADDDDLPLPVQIRDATGDNVATVDSNGRLHVVVNNLPDVQDVQIVGSAVGDTGELISFLGGADSCTAEGGTLGCEDTDGDGIGDTPPGCFAENLGFSFTVPVGKEFRLTDVTIGGSSAVTLWTSVRGGFLRVHSDISPNVSLRTPIVIQAGETLCPNGVSPNSPLLITGKLVSVP